MGFHSLGFVASSLLSLVGHLDRCPSLPFYLTTKWMKSSVKVKWKLSPK
uniref:Uncharacterized protein n=1 Tax=Anguilla anguilla TaxID=7936 RepID=A0A0E9XV02_ANGAN